jgi:hypothetical protein
MYLFQVSSADGALRGQLRGYAALVEQSAAGGTFPRPLPDSGLDPAIQAQVLAANGSVLGATRDLTGLPALYRLAPGSDTPVRQRPRTASCQAR